MKNISCLRCSKCGFEISAASPQAVCPKDAGALYVIYDLKSIKKNFQRESLAAREKSLWRYREVLPDVAPISLGEGFTPMLTSRREKNIFIKDEGLNPTGSFKARGLCLAVTMAKAYGLRKLAIPSAGNAASALAAFFRTPGFSSFFRVAVSARTISSETVLFPEP